MAIQTSISNMQIGDSIIAEYASLTSGVVGAFRNLGTSTATLIPITTNVTPNGAFYFIYVGDDYLGRKILIADRDIQNSVAWDTFNTAGIASGSGLPVWFTTIPIMTSSTAPSGTVSASSFNTGDDPFRAFDGKDDNLGWVTNSTTTGWLAYNFGTSKTITSYSIKCQNNGTSGTARAPKNWTFEGSNDGASWTVLDTKTSVTGWNNGIKNTFSIASANQNGYSMYRINVSANNGDASYLAIGEMGMSEQRQPFVIRLLTGGIASTDTNNEWDNYLVNSTLNGTITAGDNNFWHFNIGTLTSTTNTNGSTYRTYRGNGSATSSVAVASASVSGQGIRPVLVYTPPVKLYLFQDGSNIKTYSVANGWTTVGTAPVTESMFITSGITDLSVVNNTAIQQLTSPTLLYYNGFSTTSSAALTTTGLPIVNYKYKVTSDNPSFPLLKDYATGYTSQNTNDFVTISQSFFGNSNPYTITVTALQDDSSTLTNSGTVQLSDTQPTISATVSTGNALNISIGDNEADQVQYLVKLNGIQIYPALTGMTDFAIPPLNYSRVFKSNEILIGQSNAVHIEAKDQYGMLGTADLSFTGTYTGLMFADDLGGYYSSDLGQVLKYLDFGSLVAGTTSDVMKVNIKNLNPFAVSNTQIWLQTTAPSGVVITFSPSNAPFMGNSSITIPDVIASGASTSFYVRVATLQAATSGGTFDVYAKSVPS